MRNKIFMATLFVAAVAVFGMSWPERATQEPHRIRFEFLGETTKTTESNEYRYSWSLRDVECLAENIYHEARGEPEIGQVAVGYVVINRVARKLRGSDVCSVIWAPHQFSWTARPRPIQDQRAWEKAWRVARLVLNREVPNPVGPADHYHAERVKPAWARKMKKVAKIGHHIFYF